MTIESATYISDLNSSYPAATDAKSEGDDHIRLIKSTVKATFANVNAAVTSSDEELNLLDGKEALGYTLKGITTYTTGSGTYTVPSGVKALYVECYGAGGGGGGVDGSGAATAGISAGGGGGGYCSKLITGTLETSYSYAIGSGGAGGSAGDNAGADGGTTSFSGGSISLSASGGKGGAGDTAAESTGTYPGAAGIGSGGDINLRGFGGTAVGYNRVYAANFVSIVGSGRASGPHSAPSTSSASNATGSNGEAPGAGGGGVFVDGNTSANYAGGAGADGLILITEYY